MRTQKKYEKDITIKFSMFFKIMALIFILYIIILAIYLGIAYTGKIESLKDTTTNMYNSSAPILAGWGIFACNSVAIIYSIIALFLLYTHRGNEDSRWYCMPIIISPCFLLSENAILHLFDKPSDNFYIVTMSIYTTMALGVATFSSLKYSFKISGRRGISLAISQIRPQLKITRENGIFSLHYSDKDYYLSGFYSGKIFKIFYRDSKRTGTAFKIKDIFYPNEQRHFEKNNDNKIISKFENMGEIDNYDYAIFTNESHCYYFVSLKNEKEPPIIVSANLMSWIIHITKNWSLKNGTIFYNSLKFLKRIFVNIRKFVITKIFRKNEIYKYYEGMDCFNVPYNVSLNAE